MNREEKISATKKQAGRKKYKEWMSTRADLTFLEEYTGCYQHIRTQCNICGHIWSPKICDLKNCNSGCPKCKLSKGEKKIASQLDALGVAYEREKKFNWSEDRRYDFYLPDYEVLIEYDGKQHFVSTLYSPDLDEQKAIDERKTTLALVHGKTLIRIPYTSYNNIERFLREEFGGKLCKRDT